MVPFSIAGIQMNISMEHANIDAMGHKLDVLVSRFPWVQMVVFSELAPFGPAPYHAQPTGGPAEQIFCQMAAKHGLWLLPGSLFERVGDDIYNTTPVIDPNGRVVTRYRKMFPFLPYEMGIKPGTEFCVFDVPNAGRFGVSICYDMWFPETTRTLVSMGAECILHPTMTDTIDRDVELPIARASATINQCYFFDVNGVGDCGTGRSIVVGPSGYVIHEAGGGEETMPVEIDLSRVRREREVGHPRPRANAQELPRPADRVSGLPEAPGQDRLPRQSGTADQANARLTFRACAAARTGGAEQRACDRPGERCRCRLPPRCCGGDAVGARPPLIRMTTCLAPS
jgi:predicted amidohydrolase